MAKPASSLCSVRSFGEHHCATAHCALLFWGASLLALALARSTH
jgi:hypothetical protein